MSKKLYPPMKEDIPFIKCDVCQKAVKYLFRKAKSMREDTTKVELLFIHPLKRLNLWKIGEEGELRKREIWGERETWGEREIW